MCMGIASIAHSSGRTQADYNLLSLSTEVLVLLMSLKKSYIGLVKETLGATAGHHLFGWGGGWTPRHFEVAGCDLAKKLRQVREKFPNEPIYIVAHSNGGNVAIAAAQQGAPVDVIIRLGSPYFESLIDVPDGVKVLDFYDPADTIQFDLANEFGEAIYGARNVASL